MEKTSSDETTEKLDFKKILPVFVIVLVDLLGLTIIIPLLPLYAVSFDASPLLIGALGATYPIMQFIGAPLLGRLSDRFGRKPVLLVSQAGTLTGFLILGFSNALWMLFLSRLVDGLSGANISTAQAVITDSTTEKNRTQGLGLIGAAFGLGFIIGPVIAFVSLALGHNNYAVPAFVAAVFSLIAILLTAFWLQETLPAEKRQKVVKERSTFSLSAMIAALGRPGIGILLVLMFAQQFAFGGFEQLLSLFTLTRLGMSASDNSVLFVFVGVMVVAVQGYFIGRWARRYGERLLVIGGLAALALGLTLTALTPRQPIPWYERAKLEAELSTGRDMPGETPPVQQLAVELPDDAVTGWLGIGWLAVAMIPAAIGGGVLQPSINSLITKQVEPHEVGGMLGISTAFFSGANAITPVVNGAIFQAFGSSAPFLIGGAILLALFGLAIWRIKPGKEVAQVGMAQGEATP